MPPVNLDIPQEVQDRLNRTPAQRKADLDALRQQRLDAMTPEERQAAQAHIDRVNAVPDDKRPAFVQASRLAVTAKTIRAQVETGLGLRDVLDLLNPEEAAAVNWLADAVTTTRGS
jgi:hypothetical protein